MKTLQIQLPSGDWRYVTSIIKGHDFTHSIYPSRAMPATLENFNLVDDICKKYKVNHITDIRFHNG